MPEAIAGVADGASGSTVPAVNGKGTSSKIRPVAVVVSTGGPSPGANVLSALSATAKQLGKYNIREELITELTVL